jgi:rod shape-determining protein MreC
VYDKKVVRRRRAVLGVLVGLSIALLTIYFGESAAGGLHDFSRGAQAAFSPLEKGVSIAFKPIRDLANWTGDVFHAKKENKQLKKEVQQLRGQVAQNQTATRDAEQLRQLLSIPGRSEFMSGYTPVSARIIERSPTVWYATWVINKGSNDGVRVNEPVIAAGGLAGRVSSVTGGTAQVTLITDESSSVSAEVMPDGSAGLVEPEVGNPDDLLLNYVHVQKDVTLKPGQTVLTSGFTSGRGDSLFPRSIPIGRVKRVDPSEVELYQRIHVQPYVDFRKVDYVQVMTGHEAELRAQVTP